MKVKLKKIIYLLLIIFLLIQLIPREYNINKGDDSLDFFKIYSAPKQVESKIKKACYDCHSNNTNYPWYNKIQPIALLLQDHINEGKSELNFSEFKNYSKRKAKSKLKSIKNEIKDDKMPLKSYLFIHKEAKISKKEKESIIEWIDKILNN